MSTVSCITVEANDPWALATTVVTTVVPGPGSMLPGCDGVDARETSRGNLHCESRRQAWPAIYHWASDHLRVPHVSQRGPAPLEEDLFLPSDAPYLQLLLPHNGYADGHGRRIWALRVVGVVAQLVCPTVHGAADGAMMAIKTLTPKPLQRAHICCGIYAVLGKPDCKTHPVPILRTHVLAPLRWGD
ncbi:uncharacterized protein PITG_09143 [Phytophthora infestans T30-4]|uniref:Uncharacterized protein n=1 Tax=Phytophthora infestans (strain T30-4) TaxID=403677 RepID=D0NBT4_PHYIT|nr:uncharacterized protein PITG_09143 [Phytophthora infestans T30-4]EEY55239.1 hypothetical protein PITG_09143 [Phytophthora infestans T30-4]|eukprot:XP_002903463.1 hypothetical protein PITG_09143 [Phytophthora infestans T30-4]